MKDNIREDKESIILKTELINNDLLLYIYVPQDNKVYVKIRFKEYDKKVEHYVGRLTFKEYKEGNRVKINEEKTALAVFKKKGDKEVLDNFYDLEDHNCVASDFLDCAYNLYFKDKVDDYLVLIKK